MSAAIIDLAKYRQAKTAANKKSDSPSIEDGAGAAEHRYWQMATQALLGLPPGAHEADPYALVMGSDGRVSVHGPMSEIGQMPSGTTFVAALAPLGYELKLHSRPDTNFLQQANKTIRRLAGRIREAECRRIAS